MTYRDDMRVGEREARWTFFRFLPLLILVLVVLGGIGLVMRSGGKVVDTVVEREVFERSYQRSEGLKASLANDAATLAQIEQQLLDPDLDASTRNALKAQAAAARSRMTATRSLQQ